MGAVLERRVLFSRPADIRASEFNDMVRGAFEHAGRAWQFNFALKHFQPGAAQRYQMPARKERYRKRRSYRARKRGEEAADLVWSGAARAIARRRTANWYGIRVIARATASKQKVTVPIPIGHAVRANNVPDFGALTRDEVRFMTGEARNALKLRFEIFRKRKVKDEIK